MAITLTYTFVAGTRALASQVNSNFSTLSTRALDKTGDTMTGDLKFTDATYDIGKSGLTRPRDFFLSRNATIGGTLAVTGLTTLTGGATFAGHLIATDATYDIGASGATRFRDLFLSRNAVIGGTLNVTGVATFPATTIALRGVTYTLPSADGAASTVLQTNGSATLSWASVSTARYQTTQIGNYSVDFTNGASQTIFCNTNAFTVTLPTAVSQAGKTVRIIKIGSDANAITLATTSSQTIGVHATAVLKLYKQDDFIEVESDGANWKIAAEKVTIYARAYRSGQQGAVVTATPTKVQLNLETEDTPAAFDSATNYRFTVPRIGRYRVVGCVEIDGPNGTVIAAAIYFNGGEKAEVRFQPGTTSGERAIVTDTIRATAITDYFELYGEHNRGSDTAFNGGESTTWMTIEYVGN